MYDVHYRDLTFILDVDEDPACLIRDGSLGFAVQEYRADDLLGNRVDDAEVMATAITGDDGPGERFKKNGIRVLSGGYLVQDPPCPYIKDGNAVGTAVACEPFAQGFVKGDAMDTAGVGDDTDGIAILFIQDHHMGTM